MLIKYIPILLINSLLILSKPVKAEVNNYIVGNYENKLTQIINDFFTTHPTEKSVYWSPTVRGKSRYSFLIPRDGHEIASKYSDSSDLYYLSKQLDGGLRFHSNKSKTIDIIKSQDNLNLILSQNFLSDTEIGLFLKNNEKKSFGLNLNKDIIISRNALSNFSVEQSKDKNAAFGAKFVKLSNDEKSEFFGNMNYEFMPNILNVGIGHTWFEVINQFDFTVDIKVQDKKVDKDIYATFGDENMKFQLGLSQIKNNSKINMFFNLKFENALNKKNFGTNIILTSKESVFGLRNLSLKSFRRKNLNMLWRKNMKYN